MHSLIGVKEHRKPSPKDEEDEIFVYYSSQKCVLSMKVVLREKMSVSGKLFEKYVGFPSLEATLIH